jgi:hypothetical protein
MIFSTMENISKSSRHTSFFCPAAPPLGRRLFSCMVGQNSSISWRHQLPVFASLGFRALAPDMRGYGQSSAYRRHEDYALQEIVADMIDLVDQLRIEKALGRTRLGCAGIVLRASTTQ